MIDFNWTEILVLGVIAVVMFGPEKLPEFARRAARIIAYLRKVGEDARGQLRSELGPEFDDLHLSDLNPRNFVARHLLSAEDKEDLLEIRDELKAVGREASAGLGELRAGIEDAKAAATPATAAAGGEGDPAASDLLRAVAYDPEAT